MIVLKVEDPKRWRCWDEWKAKPRAYPGFGCGGGGVGGGLY